ncbi:MAG: MoxR family ATPase [Phycisphaerales bacterium]|nr:MoxR family ATPase [Phycisphaerales bacterium]
MGEFAKGMRGSLDDTASVAAACGRFRDAFAALRDRVGLRIVGQEDVVDLSLVALFAGGHVLLEGVPGLGKTLLVRSISDALGLHFSRIQFTPDLMPADVTGTTIVVEDAGGGERTFRFRRGPIFANIVLADEINRATPKSQSAMLEAMQERSVSVGGETFDLDEPFLVLATQNPIEQEGTYPLPEAQLDRFLLKITVPYAVREELAEILKRTTKNREATVEPVLDREDVLAARHLARKVVIAPIVQDYAIRLVLATHPGGEFSWDDLAHYIRVGASPRAAQAIVASAKVLALMDGRYAASFQDIRAVALPALRHRIIRSFEAEADQVDADQLVEWLLERVPADHEHPDEGPPAAGGVAKLRKGASA